MWRKWLNNITRIKEIAGVDIHLLPDNGYIINVVIIGQSSGKIVKSAAYQHIRQLNAVFEKIPAGLPITLNISGRGIVHKPAPAEGSSDIIQSLIPGANPSDYFYQYIHYSGHSDVAIIRKQTVTVLIEQFASQGYVVLNAGISLGYLADVLPMVKTNRLRQLRTSSQLIQLSDKGEMLAFEQLSQPAEQVMPVDECVVDAIMLNNYLITGFSIAVYTLANFEALPAIAAPEVLLARDAYQHKKLFITAAWMILMFLLGSLLINFFVYQHYYQRNIEAVATRSIYQNRLDNLDTLQVKVRQKEEFLQKLGWLKPASFSEISDKLAASVPEDITLTSMEIFPLTNKADIDTRFSCKRDTILVTGYCYEPRTVNQWIATMDSIDIVQSVKLLNYRYKQEEETGNFRIEIRLK